MTVDEFEQQVQKMLDLDKPYVPIRIWCQSDNTVKEIRNTYTGRMCCSLLQTGVVRQASECHLQVGHTHEDIDALFSMCTNCLRSASDLQTPRDVQRRIMDKVGPFDKLWRGGERDCPSRYFS